MWQKNSDAASFHAKSLYVGQDGSVGTSLDVTGSVYTNSLNVNGPANLADLNVAETLATGEATVASLEVVDKLSVEGNLAISTTSTAEYAELHDTITTPAAHFKNSLDVLQTLTTGGLDIERTLVVKDNANVGPLTVSATSNFHDDLNVAGSSQLANTHVGQDVHADGQANVAQLYVGDHTSSDARFAVDNDVWAGNAHSASLTVTNTLTVREGAAFNGDVTVVNQLTTSKGTIQRSMNAGSLDLSDDLEVFGNSLVQGAFSVDGNAYSQGIRTGSSSSFGSNFATTGDFDASDISATSADVDGMTNTGSLDGADTDIGGTLNVVGKGTFGCDGIDIKGRFDVEQEVSITQDVSVADDVHLMEDFTSGPVTVDGDVFARGHSTLASLAVANDLDVTGNAHFDTNLDIGGNLYGFNLYAETIEYGDTLHIREDAHVGGDFTSLMSSLFLGDVAFDGGITVEGTSTFDDDVYIARGLNSASGATFTDVQVKNAVVDENLAVSNELSVGTHFTVDGDLFALHIDTESVHVQTLEVTENTRLFTLQAANDAWIGNDVNVAGEMCIENDYSADSIIVGGDAKIGRDLRTGDASLQNLDISGDTFANTVNFNSFLHVSDDSRFNGGLESQTLTAGHATISGTTSASDAAVGGDLYVGGITSVANDATARHNMAVLGISTGASLTVGEQAYVADELTAGNTNIASVEATGSGSSSSVTVDNDLHVGGSSNVAGMSQAGSFNTGLAEVLTFGASTMGVHGNLHVGEELNVTGGVTTIDGKLFGLLEFHSQSVVVDVDGIIGRDLTVRNDASLNGLEIIGDLDVSGDSAATDAHFGYLNAVSMVTAQSFATGDATITGVTRAQDVTTHTAEVGALNAATLDVGENLHANGDIVAPVTSVSQDVWIGRDLTANTALLQDVEAHDVSINGSLDANNIDVEHNSYWDDISDADTFDVAGSSTFETTVLTSELEVEENLYTTTYSNGVTLDVEGDLSVGSSVHVMGTLDVNSKLYIGNELDVTGVATFNNVKARNINVDGQTSVSGTTTAGGDITVDDSLTTDSLVTGDAEAGSTTASNDVHITGDLHVDGSGEIGCGGADIAGKLAVTGDTSVNSLQATNDMHVGRDLTVTGPVSVSNIDTHDLAIDVDLTTGPLNVVGDGSITNELEVLSLSADSAMLGDTVVTGTLNTGDAHVHDDLDVSGSVHVDQTTTVGHHGMGSLTAGAGTVGNNLNAGHDLETSTMDVLGSAWLHDLNVANQLGVNADAKIHGDLHTGDFTIDGSHHAGSTTTSSSSITTSLQVNGASQLDGTLNGADATTQNVHATGTFTTTTLSTGDMKVDYDTTVNGNLDVSSSAYLNTLDVLGDETVLGNTMIGENLEADEVTIIGSSNSGSAHTGSAVVSGDLDVAKQSDIHGTFDVTGLAADFVCDDGIHIKGALSVSGDTEASLLNVDHDASFGALNVFESTYLQDFSAGHISVDGTTHVKGGLNAGGNADLADLTADELTSETAGADALDTLNLHVPGPAIVSGNFSGADVSVGGDLNVMTGDLNANTAELYHNLWGESNLIVNGPSHLHDLMVLGNGEFANAEVHHRFEVAGSVNVAGESASGSAVTGAFVSEDLDVKNNAIIDGVLTSLGDGLFECEGGAHLEGTLQSSSGEFAHVHVHDDVTTNELSVTGISHVGSAQSPIVFARDTWVEGDINVGDTFINTDAWISGTAQTSNVETGDVHTNEFSTYGGVSTGTQVIIGNASFLDSVEARGVVSVGRFAVVDKDVDTNDLRVNGTTWTGDFSALSLEATSITVRDDTAALIATFDSFTSGSLTGDNSTVGADVQASGDAIVHAGLDIRQDLEFTHCEEPVTSQSNFTLNGVAFADHVSIDGDYRVAAGYTAHSASMENLWVSNAASIDLLTLNKHTTAEEAHFQTADSSGLVEAENFSSPSLEVGTDVTADTVQVQNDLTLECGSATFDHEVTSNVAEIAKSASVAENAWTADLNALSLWVGGDFAGSSMESRYAEVGQDFSTESAEFDTLYVSVLADLQLTSATDASIEGDLATAGDVDVGDALSVLETTEFYGPLNVVAENFLITGNFEVDKNLVLRNGSVDVGSNVYVGTDFWIEDLEIGENLHVTENMKVQEDADIDGDLSAYGDVFLGGELNVEGDGIFRRNLIINNALNINATLTVGDDANIMGELHVNGASKLLGDLNVIGDAYFTNLTVEQSTLLKDQFTVEGYTTIDDDLEVEESVFVGENLCVLEHVSMRADFTIGGALSVEGFLTTQHNIFIGEDLDVAGDSHLDRVKVDNDVDIANDVHTDTALLTNVEIGGSFTIDNHLTGGDGSVGGDVRADSLIADGSLDVWGWTSVGGDLDVDGPVTVGGTMNVDDTASLDDLYVSEDMTVGGDTSVLFNTSVENNVHVDGSVDTGTLHADEGTFRDVRANDFIVDIALQVNGNATFDDEVSTSGMVSVSDDVNIDTFAYIGGYLSVENAGQVADDLTVGGDVETHRLWVANEVTVNEDATIGFLNVGRDFTLLGNAHYQGTLNVTGFTSIRDSLLVKEGSNVQGMLTVLGPANFNNDFTVESNTTVEGDVEIAKDTRTDAAAFNDTLWIGADFSIADDVTVSGAASCGGEGLLGSTAIEEDLFVGDNLNVGNWIDVADYASIGENLIVNGNATAENVTVQEDATVGTLTANGLGDFDGELCVQGTTQLDSLWVDGDVGAMGEFSSGNAVFNSTLNVTDIVSLGGDLVVDEYVTLGDDLSVSGSVSIGGELCVQELTSLKDDLFVDEYLSVRGIATAQNGVNGSSISITDNFEIGGDLSIQNDTWICGTFTAKQELIIQGAVSAADTQITQSLTVCGDLTVTEDSFIAGDFTTENLVVDGDTQSGRLAIEQGPFSFRYPGVTEEPVGQYRLPVPTSDYSEFVVPISGPDNGVLFSIVLTGCSFNVLEPEPIAPQVHRIETAVFDNTALVYQYEVGDIIILKGPSDPLKSIIFWDYQQDINTQGPGTLDGNLNLGRTTQIEAANEFTVTLFSDALMMMIYSPTPAIGSTDGQGNVVIQNQPVEWAKIL